MAEIIRLNTKKHGASARTDDARNQPFQLLFFTGVQYERNCTMSFAIAAAQTPNKPTTPKKVRKA
jgi:hypothetical protein